MFSRYFGDRYFAPRYWPNAGSTVVFEPHVIDAFAMYQASVDAAASFEATVDASASYASTVEGVASDGEV